MKTLLIDKVYQPISFIGFRKLISHVVKGKVEIISRWDGIPFAIGGNYPAIVRLTDYVRTRPLYAHFNYKSVFKRDQYRCQYTGKLLSGAQLTVDHIIPKSRGGVSSWDNCVTAAKEINLKKRNRTPEEAGLKLIKKPETPKNPVVMDYLLMQEVHEDWKNYLD